MFLGVRPRWDGTGRWQRDVWEPCLPEKRGWGELSLLDCLSKTVIYHLSYQIEHNNVTQALNILIEYLTGHVVHNEWENGQCKAAKEYGFLPSS